MNPMLLGSIPSPSDGTVHLGPLPIHVYGLLLAIGVVVAARMAEQRWARWGRDRHELAAIWIPIVVGGVVGARLYHVATDYQLFEDHWGRVVEIWKGGLSIWGAVLGGGSPSSSRPASRSSTRCAVTDAIAPGPPRRAGARSLGQLLQPGAVREADVAAVGTRDRSRAPAEGVHAVHDVPTDLPLRVAVLRLRARGAARGRAALPVAARAVFALYIVLYTFGRFFFENMRIDNAHHIAGLRVERVGRVVPVPVRDRLLPLARTAPDRRGGVRRRGSRGPGRS